MNKLRPILLVLTAVAALSFAHPAKADTITTFTVMGNCTPTAPFTGTTFGGTLTINVTTGVVTGINVSFQDLSAFTTINSSQPSVSTAWNLNVSNSGSYDLFLDFLTGHTPSSLVGFTGGTIVGTLVTSPQGDTVYRINVGGSITAPTGSVPDGGSTLPLLGFASLGLIALRRKLRC